MAWKVISKNQKNQSPQRIAAKRYSQVMKIIFAPIFILLFATDCSEPINNPIISKIDTIKKDTIKKEVPQTKTSSNIKYSFKTIDSLVDDIKTKIKSNLLSKKEENGMDGIGGWVYGYFNTDKTIAYLYSSYGGEFGRDETMTYYKDGNIIYAKYRFFWFDRDKNGKEVNERLVAEKLFYLPESNFAKDTMTVWNDKLKPPYPGIQFSKSAVPTIKQFVTRTIQMQDNLKKYGE